MLSTTEIIDIQKKTITTGRLLNFACASFVMATLGNRVYVLGGENGTEVMDSVEEWIEQTQAWRIAGKPATRRKLASALVVSIHLGSTDCTCFFFRVAIFNNSL